MMSIGPKIWIEEQPSRVPLFGNIGVRMTVLQLPGEELMLISPVPLTDSIRESLENLGRVRYLVGPNSTHHLSLSKYHETFPEAKLAGPKKLQEKKRKLKFQITLDEKTLPPWAPDVETLLVDSPGMMSEAVFLHKPSRTLIVTDLLFNLQKADSMIQEWFMRFNGVYRKLTMSKLGQAIWKDHSVLKEKVNQIGLWDFDQIVLAHGEIVAKNGKQAFQESFAWLFS